MSDDRYASFDYSRLISWEDRLRREWPFLETLLAAAPSKKILDLGSGTGEHARLFASHGFAVTGVDGSAAMIGKARQSTDDASVVFVEGDLLDLPTLLSEKSGAAVCLGNVLPHLRQDDSLARLASSLRAVLLPGAPVILQLLNYDRIEAKKERALPLSFLPDRDDPAASLIFLRAMELHPDGGVTFMPTVLRMRADREVPMELVASQRVEIRGWRHHEIAAALRAAGFEDPVLYGSYDRAPFDPRESRDLIVVAMAPGA